MSSYLNIFLVPKRKDEETEKKRHLLLLSYSRSSCVYQLFCDAIHPVFVGSDERQYTILDKDNIQQVKAEVDRTISSITKRVGLYEKYAADNPDYIERILSLREELEEYKEAEKTISFLCEIVCEATEGYCSFEEVCCYID